MPELSDLWLVCSGCVEEQAQVLDSRDPFSAFQFSDSGQAGTPMIFMPTHGSLLFLRAAGAPGLDTLLAGLPRNSQ